MYNKLRPPKYNLAWKTKHQEELYLMKVLAITINAHTSGIIKTAYEMDNGYK